jgi:hypothetical protein
MLTSSRDIIRRLDLGKGLVRAIYKGAGWKPD